MKGTLVKTGIPYALIWDEDRLDIRVDDHVFNVRFKRKYRELADRVVVPAAGTANNLELLYDRLGRVAYSEIKILLPTQIAEHEEVLKWIHRVINRLIEVYRFTQGEFHLDVVPKNELWPYDSYTSNEDGTVSLVHGESFGGGLTIARKVPVPDEARQLLQNGTELPISRTLYLNARREELFENHRLAVVEAETAFETLIDEVVSRYYRRQGLPDTRVAKILKCGLENLLKDHIPRCCGEQFVGTQEYTDWDCYLYSLRNAVVHDGASVDGNEVKKALDVAEKVLEWLETRIPKY